MIDECLRRLEPCPNFTCIENHKVFIVTFMTTVEQQVEVLAHLVRNTAWLDVVLMQERPEMTVFARGDVSRYQQRGDRVEAGVVEPTHTTTGMPCFQEDLGFLKGLPGSFKPIGEECLLLRRLMSTPSWSTF